MKTLTDFICEDVQSQQKTGKFQAAFEGYLEQVSELVGQYEHHRASSATKQQLLIRFQWETVLLHVVTTYIKEYLSIHYPHTVLSFPPEESTNVFGWYQISREVAERFRVIVSKALDTTVESLALSLSEITGQLLAQYVPRTTGEFYTPLSLAEHLLELSGLEAGAVLSGKRVVDPSCGGGIILLSIATRVVSTALQNQVDPQTALKQLTQHLYGFDIQPFAVALTQTILLFVCTPLYARTFPREPLAFTNIRLADPLSINVELGFDFIIGNPPYVPAKRDNISYISNYDMILNGHVNLYALFLWWSVQAATTNGIIAFLVPQTLASGLYFEKLRLNLSQNTILRAVTKMTARQGVVRDADQKIMAICLQRKPVEDTNAIDSTVNIIVTHDGEEIAACEPSQIMHSRIVRYVRETPVWIISDCGLDYEIEEAILNRLHTSIADLAPAITCQNGGFVWNQHKERLSPVEHSNTVPLISSLAVGPFEFTFPYAVGSPQRERAFVIWESNSAEKAYQEKAVLIKRITPRKMGRRLIAAMPSNDFLFRYPKYLVENHVNAVLSQDPNFLHGILGWINSDLAQFIFQMRNGNAQVSIYELLSLPGSSELLVQLAPLTIQILAASNEGRTNMINDLNHYLLEYFSLAATYHQRIIKALK